jgi:hypothetical protein
MVPRRPFHRLVSALVGVVTVLGLAGCSPDPHPYLALTMVDDRPTLLIAACARSQVSYITLRESDKTVSPAPTGSQPSSREWSVASPLSTPAPNGVKHPTAAAPAQITLFERPSSWLITQETMRAFREDAEYRVNGGLANVASLEFTVALLRELAPGTVLTGVGYQDQHVVSEAKFEKAAQKDCAGPRRG